MQNFSGGLFWYYESKWGNVHTCQHIVTLFYGGRGIFARKNKVLECVDYARGVLYVRSTHSDAQTCATIFNWWIYIRPGESYKARVRACESEFVILLAEVVIQTRELFFVGTVKPTNVRSTASWLFMGQFSWKCYFMCFMMMRNALFNDKWESKSYSNLFLLKSEINNVEYSN